MMKLRNSLFALGLSFASVVVACGDDDNGDSARGDGGGSLTMDGAVGGLTLVSSDAFGVVTTTSTGKARFRAIFEDRPSLCSTGIQRKNATVLNIDIESANSTLEPGTFPIYNETHATPPYADAPFVKLDDACKPVPDRGAKSGSVTLTSVTAASVSGTFDITYADGHIQGSFTAPLTCSSWPETSCAL